MPDIVLQIVAFIGLALLFTGGVFGVLSFVAFDRLLRQVCAESEEAWIKLGKPCGFFWVPPGVGMLGVTKAGLVRGGLYGKWSAGGDAPFEGSAEGVARLRRYKRIGNWCFLVGLLLWAGQIAMMFAA